MSAALIPKLSGLDPRPHPGAGRGWEQIQRGEIPRFSPPFPSSHPLDFLQERPREVTRRSPGLGETAEPLFLLGDHPGAAGASGKCRLYASSSGRIPGAWGDPTPFITPEKNREQDGVTGSAPARGEIPSPAALGRNFPRCPGEIWMFLGLIPSAFPCTGLKSKPEPPVTFPAPALILLDIPAAAAASIMSIQTGN